MRLFQLCCFLAVAIVTGCAPLQGTSTETTNGICIEVSEARIAGTTLPGVMVTLCSRKYTVIDTAGKQPVNLIVGANGSFEFPPIDSGVYILTAFTPGRDSGGCIAGIRAGNGSTGYSDTALFLPVGSIAGTVPPDSSGRRTGTIVCLPGTTIADTAESSNTFSLTNVPAGRFSIKAFPLYGRIIIGTGPKPGDTTTGPYVEVQPGQASEWNF